ncbi:MAG: ChbG/HpnK family deacetylase [Erysipelotrichaceae bacterium]|nr:ChbG/HpnK family deacetylase [Erysipelotrichaceae bacterium]
MRKRLVYRADDIGYTEAFDLGVYRAFEEGIATSADVMLDSPHTVQALLWLKDRPWISVGWHRHLWESPVLPKEEVPSMVDEEGRFKWRHRHRELMNEVIYEEAYREFMAEAELCRSIIGHYPDSCTTKMQDDVNDLERAFRDVVHKLKIPTNFWYDSPENPGDPAYEYLHFRQWDGENFVGWQGEQFKLKNFDSYDPYTKSSAVVWESDEQIWRIGGHPGYCDMHIMQESSCNLHRCKDLEACIRLRDWVIENHIELINQRDVLYGTNEFQDHLRDINSPLWTGNMR